MVTSIPFAGLTEYPIIQAPMVGVSTPELAAAVSNAGGLGSIGIGASSLEAADAMIAQTRALTARPFNVNLFCHQPARPDAGREADWLAYLRPRFAEFGAEPPASLDLPYPALSENPEMLNLLLEHRPAVVSFHFGLPESRWIELLHDAGIHVLATATSLKEAELVEAAGVDGIVAQGREAGGHSGVFTPAPGWPEMSTLPLVRLVASRCRTPVIAAGGIMDGEGIRAALALGASAAQLGTAFVLCPESAADDEYRAALGKGGSVETRLTHVISGRPARGIVDCWWSNVDTENAPPCPAYPIAYSAGKALKAAARAAGSQEFNAYWAGQGAGLARALPAAELVRVLMAEVANA